MSSPNELLSVPVETPEAAAMRAKNRRLRSMALGLLLATLVIMVYVLTLVKLGPDVFHRDL